MSLKHFKKHGTEEGGDCPSQPLLIHWQKHQLSLLSHITFRQRYKQTICQATATTMLSAPAANADIVAMPSRVLKPLVTILTVCTYTAYNRLTFKPTLEYSFKNRRLQTNTSSLPLIQHSMFQSESEQKKSD